MARPAFDRLVFGFKSAEAELRNNPELLDGGFFESDGVVHDLLHSPRFIVLGYKGSGKSAIAAHLDLMATSDPTLFVDVALLKDFPFDEIPHLVPGEENVSVRTSLAWSILLLLRVVDSLSQDEALIDPSGNLRSLVKHLERLGVLQKKRFRDLVFRAREVNLGVELPKLLKGDLAVEVGSPITTLKGIRDTLLDVICTVETESRHLVIIDGLDEVFDGFERYYPMIASLIHEVDDLNANFDEADASCKLILLCRADIYERLPSPNINKLRDYSSMLNWYSNPQRPRDSKLFALATHRARLGGYTGSDVVTDYLPAHVTKSGTDKSANASTAKFLLDHTRHTPRDFLQVLHHIQRASAETGSVVARSTVITGLRQFSVEYFLPEIKDELAGYLEPDEINDCLQVVGGLRQREFTLNDLHDYARRAGLDGNLDLDEALRILFDCSAIGNIVYRPRVNRGPLATHYTFRYRNRNSSINYDERFVIHRGLWKSFNLN